MCRNQIQILYLISTLFHLCSRYYQEGDSLTLDVGPFMKALEVYRFLDIFAKHNHML